MVPSPFSAFINILTGLILIFLFSDVTFSIVGVKAQEDPAYSKSSIGFCEHDYYVPKTKNQCSYGINFGRRSPKCVCIKGIYRMYLDNCEIADGFAEEVCTLLNDTVTGVTVKGIRLTREPDFSQFALVCEKVTSAATEWDWITENQKVKIMGTSFYTIHAEAKIAEKRVGNKVKRQICIEKKMKDKDQICLVKHEENLPEWPHITMQDKTIEIQVKTECPPNMEWKPMRTNKCFSPLTLYDADCQVPCDKSNVLGSTGFGAINTRGFADLDGNCTDPTEYLRHENNFVDRKLLRYVLMKSLRKHEMVQLDNFTSDGLNKSYVLLDKVYKLAEAACAFRQVPKTFMQTAYELFSVLLKGSSFQYEIKLSDADFKWISDILDECNPESAASPVKKAKKTRLYVDEGDKCRSKTRALGFCKPTDLNGCHEVPVKISQKYADYETKHYIPETVWLFMDIVHMQCFSAFEESYRMWHILQQTIEKLFSTPVKDFWHNPTWDQKTKAVLLSAGADDAMWNMEVCAESVYQANGNIVHRLKRPDAFEYNVIQRKKRATEHVSSMYDVYCSSSAKDFKTPDSCIDGKAKKAQRKPAVVNKP